MAQIIKRENAGAAFLNGFADQTRANTEADMRMSTEAAKNKRYDDENARLNEKAAMESAAFKADIRVRGERSKGRPTRDVSWASTRAQNGQDAILRIGREIEELNRRGQDSTALTLARSRMEAEQDQRLTSEGEYLDYSRAQATLLEVISQRGTPPTPEEIAALEPLPDPGESGYLPPIVGGGSGSGSGSGSRGGSRGGSSGGGGQGLGGPDRVVNKIDDGKGSTTTTTTVGPDETVATRTHEIRSLIVGAASQQSALMNINVVDNRLRDILDQAIQNQPLDGAGEEAMELYNDAINQVHAARRLLDVNSPNYDIEEARRAAEEANTAVMVATTPALAEKQITAEQAQSEMNQRHENDVMDMRFLGVWRELRSLNVNGVVNPETGEPWLLDGTSLVTDVANTLERDLKEPALSRGGPNSGGSVSQAALKRHELFAAVERYTTNNPGVSQNEAYVGVHNQHVMSRRAGVAFTEKGDEGSQWMEYVNHMLGDPDVTGKKWYSSPHTAAITKLNEFAGGFWEEDKANLPPAAQKMANAMREARELDPNAEMGDVSRIFATRTSYKWQGKWDAWFDIGPGWEAHSTNAVFEGVIGGSAASGIDIAVFADLSMKDIAQRAGKAQDSDGYSPAQWNSLGQSLVDWMKEGPEPGLDIQGQAKRIFSMIPYGEQFLDAAKRGLNPTELPGIAAEYHKVLSGLDKALEPEGEILPGPAVREKSKTSHLFNWMGNSDKRNKVEATRFATLMKDTNATEVLAEMAEKISAGGSPNDIDPITAAMPSDDHITQYMTWRDAGIPFTRMPSFLKQKLRVISEQIILAEQAASVKKFNEDSDQHQMDRQVERKPMEARFEKMKRDRHRRELNQREQSRDREIRKARAARSDANSRAGDWDKMTPVEVAEMRKANLANQMASRKKDQEKMSGKKD